MWTPEAIETARALRAKGMAMKDIVEMLEHKHGLFVTREAVIGKLWREERKRRCGRS